MENLTSWIQPAIIIALILFVWRDTNRKFEQLDDKIERLTSRIDCLEQRLSALTERVAKLEVAVAMILPMGRPFGMATGTDPLAPSDTSEQDQGDDHEETE